MSFFSSVELAKPDPILGITEAFRADPRQDKVNLGIGVYLDESGNLPLMDCVREAELGLLDRPWSYLPIDGLRSFTHAVRPLIFGENVAAESGERIVTVQTLAGTGALKVGADFLRQLQTNGKVLISDPSWENHRAIFSHAGFAVENYRYYDARQNGINFEGMLADLRAAVPGTVVVLHACCHNPTGYDLTSEQWDAVVTLAAERRLVPFLDMAYQGFGRGLVEDRLAIDKFIASGIDFLVAHSFSKILGLYGERIGSLSVVTGSADEARKVLSQLKIVIRSIYSSPPTHGAVLVAEIFGDTALRELWEQELGTMRERINRLRVELVSSLSAKGITDMDFIAEQRGMFSYSGLTREQMIALRAEHGVYGLESGRICLSGLNARNLGRVVDAIGAVRD